MSDTLNQSSATAYCLLLRFVWGESGAHTALYTNWTDDVIVDSDTYLTVDALGSKIETRLAVTSAAQTGTVKTEPWTALMVPVEPLIYLIRDSAFAPVTCTISEVDPTDPSPVPTILWSGPVTQTWNNPREAPGTIKFEIADPRLFIQYPLGVESKTTCARTFGDVWCGVDLAPLKQSATITAISGNLISASSLSIPGGKPDNYFSAGVVNYDGLSISIVDGSAGVSSLRLLQKPPPEWTGVTAVFTPGCSKTYTGPRSCTAWENTARFFGVGIRKPSASPLLFPR